MSPAHLLSHYASIYPVQPNKKTKLLYKDSLGVPYVPKTGMTIWHDSFTSYRGPSNAGEPAFGDVTSFFLRSMSGPDRFVDSCGNSQVNLAAGIEFSINSGISNIPSSLGFYGSIFLADERLVVEGGLQSYYGGVVARTYKGGMMDDGFYRELNPPSDMVNRSSTEFPNRIYSVRGSGFYLNKDETPDASGDEVRLYGSDGRIKVYRSRNKWKPLPNPDFPAEFHQVYFLSEELGPLDQETGVRWRRSIEWDADIDRIRSITVGNDKGGAVQHKLTFSYVGSRAFNSELSQITEIRGGDQKTWNFSDQGTPGFLRQITSPEGIIQLYYNDAGRLNKIVNNSVNTGLPIGHLDFSYDSSSRVASIKGPYRVNNVPREIKLNYLGSSNKIERVDVLDNNSKSYFYNAEQTNAQERYVDIEQTDKFGKQFSLNYAFGLPRPAGQSLTTTSFVSLLPALENPLTVHRASTDANGKWLIADYVDEIRTNTLTMKRTALNAELTSFKDEYPLLRKEVLWDKDENGLLTCVLERPMGRPGQNCATSTVVSGDWGSKWVCTKRGAYVCLESETSTGSVDPKGYLMPSSTLKNHVAPDAPWQIVSQERAVNGFSLPLVTIPRDSAGRPLSYEVQGRFKQVFAQYNWYGPQSVTTFPNGPNYRSLQESSSVDGAGNLLSYVYGANATQTWALDPDTHLPTASTWSRNGVTASENVTRSDAGVVTGSSGGLAVQSQQTSGAKISAYVSGFPDETKLSQRINNECDPQDNESDGEVRSYCVPMPSDVDAADPLTAVLAPPIVWQKDVIGCTANPTADVHISWRRRGSDTVMGQAVLKLSWDHIWSGAGITYYCGAFGYSYRMDESPWLLELAGTDPNWAPYTYGDICRIRFRRRSADPMRDTFVLQYGDINGCKVTEGEPIVFTVEQ